MLPWNLIWFLSHETLSDRFDRLLNGKYFTFPTPELKEEKKFSIIFVCILLSYIFFLIFEIFLSE